MFFDDTNLIRSLYAGIFEAPLWSGFLEGLQARVQAASVCIVMLPADGAEPATLQSGPIPNDELTVIFARTTAGGGLRDGRVYSLEELAEGDIGNRIRAITGRHGITNLRAIRTTQASGLQAWLACLGGVEVGAPTGALLATLGEHLSVALRSFELLEGERYRSEVATETMQRISLGWFTLDARGTIIEATPDAEQFLAQDAPLSRGRYDRLIPQSRNLDRELTALIAAYADGGEQRPKAFTLSVDPWFNMLVTPAPKRRMLGAKDPAALVYLSCDRWREADRCEQLVELFGLLPSEARLAWLLAQATSIADAAKALGLTIETARNYSKKIYAKTGARGQAELVRIVLTSVLALR